MSVNVSILTETAKQVAELDVAGYMNGVAAHVGGDWSAHTSVRVHDTAFADEAGNSVTAKTLRLLTSAGASSIALALPAVASGSVPAAQGVPPFIIIQPQSASAAAGETVQFSVTVISATSPSYLWTRTDGETVVGNTASNLLLSPVAKSDAGTYRCEIENDFGTTQSNYVILTVS